jgi:hypothetical protein
MVQAFSQESVANGGAGLLVAMMTDKRFCINGPWRDLSHPGGIEILTFRLAFGADFAL